MVYQLFGSYPSHEAFAAPTITIGHSVTAAAYKRCKILSTGSIQSNTDCQPPGIFQCRPLGVEKGKKI